MTQGDALWTREVRPEWTGHTWRSFETSGAPALVREARVWAEAPNGVLYVHSSTIRGAYGVAVAVSQRAVWTICQDSYPAHLPFAVGVLEELSVPEDPDPDYTALARAANPKFSSLDTRHSHLDQYVARLGEVPLALLRLPVDLDEDGTQMLDRIANERYENTLPTLIAGVVPPRQMAVMYGKRIAWRLGFANPDGSPIGRSTPDAAALDVDHPPGE